MGEPVDLGGQCAEAGEARQGGRQGGPEYPAREGPRQDGGASCAGVLVLGFAGLVNVGVEQFLGFPLGPPWLKNTLLFGIPVLIVAAQMLAEWQAERKRRAAEALAVKTEAVQEGYFRIGPYVDTARGPREIRSRGSHP